MSKTEQVQDQEQVPEQVPDAALDAVADSLVEIAEAGEALNRLATWALDHDQPTEDELREALAIRPAEWSWKATSKNAVSIEDGTIRQGDRVVIDNVVGFVDKIELADGAVLKVKITGGNLRKVADRPQPTLEEQDEPEPVDEAASLNATLEEHAATCESVPACRVDPDTGGIVWACEIYRDLASDLGIAEEWPNKPDDLPVVDNDLPSYGNGDAGGED